MNLDLMATLAQDFQVIGIRVVAVFILVVDEYARTSAAHAVCAVSCVSNLLVVVGRAAPSPVIVLLSPLIVSLLLVGPMPSLFAFP